MFVRRSAFWLTIAAASLLGALALPAAAQDAPRGARGYNAIFENLDAIMEAYTRMLVRKYDLTDEQAQLTRDMLEGKAREFLSAHESEIREVVDRMFDVRLGAEMSPEELVAWGQRVTPLYEEAKKIIVTGNNEFRELLTEDQRKIHDEDLKLMNQSFATTEQQLKKIVQGEMTVEEFRKGGRATPTPTPAVAPGLAAAGGGQQPAPAVPAVQRPVRGNVGGGAPSVAPTGASDGAPPPAPGQADGAGDHAAAQAGGTVSTVGEDGSVVTTGQTGETVVTQPPVVVQPEAGRGAAHAAGNPARQPNAPAAKPANRQYESDWERYTREFIAKYNLNDEQAAKANATLKDCQEQAARVIKGKESQIEQIEKQISELKSPENKDKDKATKLADLEKQKNKLLEPIGDIFEKKLKPRLDTLPTRAQRKAAEAAAKPAPAKEPEKPAARPGEKK